MEKFLVNISENVSEIFSRKFHISRAWENANNKMQDQQMS